MLPLRCVVFLLIFIVGALITGKAVEEISNCWSIVASFVNVVTILLLILTAKKCGSNYWDLVNYRKGETTVKQVIGMTIFILLVGIGGMYLAGYVCYRIIPYAPPMLIAPIPVWLAAINIIVLPVSTALAEDGLYLGCGVNQIKNKYAAVIVPALFFALQHCFIPTVFDVKYIVYRFLSFLPLTLILCYNYYKKRNPLPIMIGHAVIDVATAVQIFVMSMFPELYEKICAI